MTVLETTWYKKILGMNRTEREVEKTFCSVCSLRFLCLCFGVKFWLRASPSPWEYQALTFHICSAFSTAAKVPANMLLFFFTSSAFTGIEINSSSREKKRRREGREEMYCCNIGCWETWCFLRLPVKHQMVCQFCLPSLTLFESKHPYQLLWVTWFVLGLPSY